MGWLDAVKPVFLDSSGVAGAVLYTVESGARRARRRPLSRPFEVPPKPIDFSGFLGAPADPSPPPVGPLASSLARPLQPAPGASACSRGLPVSHQPSRTARRANPLHPRSFRDGQPGALVCVAASGERVRFEQISTARLDPRFAGADTAPPPPTQGAPPSGQYQDVAPVAGTLVVFDSVTLPHQVQPITGTRQRIAATG